MDDDQGGATIRFYNTTEMGLREEKPFLVMKGPTAEAYKQVQKALDYTNDLLEEIEKSDKKRRKREREEEDDDDEEVESPFHGAEREGDDDDDEDDYEKSLDDGDFDPDFEEDDDTDFDDEDLEDNEAEALAREWRSQAKPTHELEEEADPEELARGTEIEAREHDVTPEIGKRIALDHLREISDYYTRLAKMEREARADGAMKSLVEDGNLMRSMKLKGWFPEKGVLRKTGIRLERVKVRLPSEIMGNL